MATTRAPVKGPSVLHTTIIPETSCVVRHVLKLILFYIYNVLVSINIFYFLLQYLFLAQLC